MHQLVPISCSLHGSVVEQMVAVILDIHTVILDAPDMLILYRNQFLDLWACNRALEKPKWQQIPLVLYDSDLAKAL